MNFTIGPKDEPGEEHFQTNVVTKGALAKMIGRHDKMVVIDYFSMDVLLKRMNEILIECNEANWEKAAEKLNRHMFWEFDNYQPYEASRK